MRAAGLGIMDRMERNRAIFELGEAMDKAQEALLEINALGHKMSSGTAADKTSYGLTSISKWQRREGPPDKKMENVDRRDLRVGKKLRRQAVPQ